ncbi:MAG: NTP transferase domain-containing protein [Armatimonadota bacterium]
MVARPRSPEAVPALVLAGGRTSPEFAAEAGTPHRSLAEINGWPMVRYVLHALRQAETIGEVILVSPAGFPRFEEADEQVVAEGTLPENISAGLTRCPGAAHVLLVTGDIPFVTPAAVDDYVRQCRSVGADCCYAAVPREACEKSFPGMRRTYFHDPETVVTGGNVVFQRVEAFPKQAALLEEAHRRRKNPLFLVRLIGPGNLLKFLLKRLTLADIDRAASSRMGVQCRLVVTPHASLGTDVDRPDDLRHARGILRPPE